MGVLDVRAFGRGARAHIGHLGHYCLRGHISGRDDTKLEELAAVQCYGRYDRHPGVMDELEAALPDCSGGGCTASSSDPGAFMVNLVGKLASLLTDGSNCAESSATFSARRAHP